MRERGKDPLHWTSHFFKREGQFNVRGGKEGHGLGMRRVEKELLFGGGGLVLKMRKGGSLADRREGEGGKRMISHGKEKRKFDNLYRGMNY